MRVASEPLASIEVENIDEDAWLVTAVAVVNNHTQLKLILWRRWRAIVAGGFRVVEWEEQEWVTAQLDFILQKLIIKGEVCQS